MEGMDTTNLVHFFMYPTRNSISSQNEWREIQRKRDKLVHEILRCQYKDKETPENLFSLFETWVQSSERDYETFFKRCLFETWSDEEWKTNWYQTCVIYYLLQATFEINCRDGKLIGNILRYLETKDCNFRFIMPSDKSELIDFPVINDGRHPTDYFLRHACEQRMVSSKSRKKIVDTNVWSDDPCVYAIWSRSPRLLLVLLQNRAGKKQFGYGSPDEYLMKQAYYEIEWRVRYLEVPSDQVETHPETREFVKCIWYILRVCSQFNYFRRKKRFEKITNLLPIPHLSDRIHQPLPLLHLCRLRIRERLHENWQLPIGINLLPVPERMRNYIHLLLD